MIEQLLSMRSPSPNPDFPPFGNMTAGFYGVRTEEDVISASALATAIGLSTGIVETSVSPSWLEFASKSKRILYATRAFRHSLSWEQIYNVGAMFDTLGNQGVPTTVVVRDQNAEVILGGKRYRVRGMTVTEWNTLVLPLVQSWVPGIISSMNIGNNNGSARWMLDFTGTVNSRQWRGWSSVTTIGNNPAWTTAYSGGWAPVLEPLD